MIPNKIIIPPKNCIIDKYSPNISQARKAAVTGSLIKVREASPVFTFPKAQVINPIPINWLIKAKQNTTNQPEKEFGKKVSFANKTITSKVTALKKVPTKNII